ncbi:MAG: TRAP transporter large permease subunit, partial [Oceanobacter sp.]
MTMLIPLFLLLLALAGTPLFVVIAASAIWGFYQTEVDLMVMAVEIFRVAEMPVLVAIPLFTFAGYLMGESKTPQRLVRITDALLGWMPGGLAIVALVTCALFTAFTGASGVTIVALGALLVPALKKAGYRQNFNLGLVTTSGSLGLLFAPSLPLILYGVVAQQMSLDTPVSIDDLFIAGILPGTLMIAALSIYSALQPREANTGTQPFDAKEAWDAIRDTKWEIPLPIVVLGGIYGGVIAVSEAAAITALYVLITTVVIRKEISLKKL